MNDELRSDPLGGPDAGHAAGRPTGARRPSRVVIVSNRLPVTVSRSGGGLAFKPSAGGLATGLASVYRDGGGSWVGWPGIPMEQLDETDRERVRERLAGESCHPVSLSAEQVDRYYLGFSNRTLWPLSHYFAQFATFDPLHWDAYREVNEAFAERVLEVADPDDTIWVHDYHLMLLPRLLRERLPGATIGYFHHIPFPAFEVFRLLPWRRELLEGLLGADLIGFHTYSYVQHFLDSVRRLAGHEHRLGRVALPDRIVRADAFPMGIDFARFAEAGDREDVKREIGLIRREIGDRRLVLSVDRLDYSKGIPQRLDAFERFLEQNPERQGETVLVMVAVPSRTGVPQYRTLRRQVEQRIGEINGRFGRLGWMPVWFLYRNVPFPTLAALYHEADVCVVTPLRDGMNLVAKEYVAARSDGRGVLVLSEMAGAVKELPEAIVVNPNAIDETAASIEDALAMPEAEKIDRCDRMRRSVARRDIHAWTDRFLRELAAAGDRRRSLLARRLDRGPRSELLDRFRTAADRLIILNFNGTLLPSVGRPRSAEPDPDLLRLLDALLDDPRNLVAIVSGRDREALDRWFAGRDLALTAEHGAWQRLPGGRWRRYARETDWKAEVRAILELHCAGTPGSFIEEKSHSLAWHYRAASPALAGASAGELASALSYLAASLELGITHGKKVVEVRDISITKGHAVRRLLGRRARWDMILCVGDDASDEEMFRALPGDAFAIKVGFDDTHARFWVDGTDDVRGLLEAVRAVATPAAQPAAVEAHRLERARGPRVRPDRPA